MSLTTTERERITQQPNGASNGKHRQAAARRPLWPIVAGLIAVLAIVAVGGYFLLNARATATGGQGLTFTVARGPIVVSVTESGTIKAAEQEIIKNEIEGQSTLLYLIPEGTRVQRGDLLAELDVTRLVDDKVDREISVQNAEASWIRAREELEVTKNQAHADVSKARLDYQFAQEDLRKYLNGDYPKQLNEATNRITIAEEEYERALEKYEGSKRLYEQRFISETELKADDLARKRARVNLDLARQELALLQDFDHTRQIDQLTADVEQKEMALERAERKASADVIQAEAELRARQSELDRQRDRLKKITEQIAKGRIYAPREGLVVYATSAQSGGFRGNQEPLQEGQTVRERQDLIHLPTATQMVAEIKIHESSLEKVRVGMPVRVSIDALPGRSFWGEVARIAPLPDAQSMWMNPDLKVYNTDIRISGLHEDLRTGMSCRAEIIVQNYPEATYVPVQSIVRVSGQPTAFVVNNDGNVEQRPVEIGQDNNRMVVIRDGLEQGERVLLAPPLGDTGTMETLKPDDIPEEKAQQADTARQNPPVRPQQPPPGMEGGPDGPGSGGGMNGPGTGGQGMGGPGGQGGGDQVRRAGSNPAMQRLMQQATEEEQQTLRSYFQNQDMAGGQAYLRELAEKYGVDLPAMSPQRGGQRERGGSQQGGERQDHQPPAQEGADEGAEAPVEQEAL